MQIAIVKLALDGAPHCGDECAYWRTGKKTILCVVDGLGHGEYAEKAASAAINYVARHLSSALPELFAGCDSALRKTRGVAMGIVVIDEGTGKLTYAGIGNTRALVAGAKTYRIRSNYGIIGGGYKTLSPESSMLKPCDLVLLATDGMKERIDLSGYDDMQRADVQKLAEKIIQDWRNERDDAAVLVYKYKPVG